MFYFKLLLGIILSVFLVASATGEITGASPLCMTYKVQPGDTPSTIATKMQVDYEALIQALQQCINYVGGDILAVGQEVCLPPYIPSCQYVVTINDGDNVCQYYNIQFGDTISSLAIDFQLEDSFLKEINDELLDADAPLTPGEYLRLPSWNPECPNPEMATTSCQLYSAKSGETLSSIAAMFRTTVERLLEVNPSLTLTAILSTSQQVKIPPFPASCGAGIQVAGPSLNGLNLCRVYRFQEGDSFSTIANMFGFSSEELISFNSDLGTTTAVSIGTSIKLPPWDDSCPKEGIEVEKPNDSNLMKTIPPDELTDIISSLGPAVSENAEITVTAPPPQEVILDEEEITNSEQVDSAGQTDASPPQTSVPAMENTILAPTEEEDTRSNPATLVQLVIEGSTADEFTRKEPEVRSIIAAAAGVPLANASQSQVSPIGSRRLLSSDTIEVTYGIEGNINTISSNLQNCTSSGYLSQKLSEQDLGLKKVSVLDKSGEAQFIAYANDPPTDEESTLPLGAIIGGSIGIFVVIVVVTSIFCFWRNNCNTKKERRQKAKLQRPGVNAFVTLATTAGPLRQKTSKSKCASVSHTKQFKQNDSSQKSDSAIFAAMKSETEWMKSQERKENNDSESQKLAVESNIIAGVPPRSPNQLSAIDSVDCKQDCLDHSDVGSDRSRFLPETEVGRQNSINDSCDSMLNSDPSLLQGQQVRDNHSSLNNLGQRRSGTSQEMSSARRISPPRTSLSHNQERNVHPSPKLSLRHSRIQSFMEL